MKKIFCLLLISFLLVLPCMAEECNDSITPDEAYDRLLEGNDRFISGECIYPNLTKEQMIKTTEEGQNPFAVIVTCSDSRIPVNHLFDAGIGDLFVIRVAGNVSSIDDLATIEYGVKHLHTPLLVVMGHTHCGAVTASVSGSQEEGALPFLLYQIRPAVMQATKKYPDLEGEEFLEKCIEENVWATIEQTFEFSRIIREAVRNGDFLILGAIYNIETGEIEWMGPHPDQDIILGK